MTNYIEKNIAKVTKTDDPEQRGRIKVTCVALTGDDETEVPMWIEPVFDWGMFVVPNVGEVVEIETTPGGTLDEVFGQSSIDQLNPHWRGSRFYDVKALAPAAKPHPDFQGGNYGKRRGFHTKFHTVVFDDTSGSEEVTITFRDAKGKTNVFTIHSGFLSYSEGGTLPTLRLFGSGSSTQATFGDGVAHPAIAEHLQALWSQLQTDLDGFFQAVATYIAAMVTGAGGGPAGLVASAISAGGAFATYAATLVEGPTPNWDNNIKSAKVSIPDNF